MAAPPPGYPPLLPPLPPGWTEHQAPTGQAYYYHAASGQSTYVRPLPAVIPGTTTKKKKERPRTKTPVPGTAWLRVTTTEGNVFWTHKERKESLWEVPDEIKDQVAAMEREEREKEAREAAEMADRERAEKERVEVERARLEQEEVQRVTEEVTDAVKRKAEGPAEDDIRNSYKRLRVEDEVVNEEMPPPETGDKVSTDVVDVAPSSDENTTKTVPEVAAPSSDKPPAFTVPNQVDISLDEAKALFKTLLQEKEINPLHPWDISLPRFINDPRYVLLPSVAARRDAFDDYCRDAIRAQRLARAAAQKADADDVTDDPSRAAYSRLLREEVTSTRTTWHEFRRRWKKDRRFFGWAGDREREREFRAWVHGLGETKRKAAEKAEREFFKLLQEHKEISADSTWKEVKRKIDPEDPRYDAVGSSSLREELFATYVKTLGTVKPADNPTNDSHVETTYVKEGDPASTMDAASRRQRAERQRAEVVRRDREGLERELGRTRGAVGREEGEREFMMLLTDAVRDPQARWDTTAPQLAHDPRYVLCALPTSKQRDLFAAHISHLQIRPRAALHALFAAHSPTLDTTWHTLGEDAHAAICGSAAAKRLGLGKSENGGEGELEREFARWQRSRWTEARNAFDKMLGDNAFLEFWGRMGKAGGKELPILDDEDVEGEGGGGTADLKKLAKSVDVAEVGRVLNGDARWTVFDHVPEQRERWLKDYMEHLAAPKLSVHAPGPSSNYAQRENT